VLSTGLNALHITKTFFHSTLDEALQLHLRHHVTDGNPSRIIGMQFVLPPGGYYDGILECRLSKSGRGREMGAATSKLKIEVECYAGLIALV